MSPTSDGSKRLLVSWAQLWYNRAIAPEAGQVLGADRFLERSKR